VLGLIAVLLVVVIASGLLLSRCDLDSGGGCIVVAVCVAVLYCLFFFFLVVFGGLVFGSWVWDVHKGDMSGRLQVVRDADDGERLRPALQRHHGLQWLR